ncbi:MAG: isoprenylcysteine carboxylmethyltransferase family protein [Anaerolineales bacterium]|nr:isoprenylcysteine carboxylmethyltransferase family protein [Anaerolineales bacterium]
MFWILLTVLGWGFLHSLLASLPAKDFFRRRLGAGFMRFYRLAYNLFAGFSFLPVLALTALTPDRQLYLVPLPWSGLMAFGMLLAVAAMVAGFLQSDPWEFLGLRQVAGSLSVRGGELIVTGLYRHVRHPLYTAGLAFIWLMPIMTANVLAVNVALTIYIVVGAYLEERKLLGEFGQAYTDYSTVTPMLIPFLKWNKRRPGASG